MIVIIGDGYLGFPQGTAATSRVANYARGLAAEGQEVHVVCLNHSEDPRVGVFNTAAQGVFEGISYEYACGRTVRPSRFLTRRWMEVKGPIMGALRTRKLLRGKESRAILIYASTAVTSILFWLVARLSSAALVADVCEFPFVKRKPGVLSAAHVALYEHTIYRLFDGVIVISGYLERHMRPLLRAKTGMLRVPIFVDADAFAQATSAEADNPVVAYCGILNEAKDGVITLMRSFALATHDIPDARLLLIGDSYAESNIPRFRSVAAEIGIADRTEFTGQVKRDEIPSLLKRAQVLALARPSGQQADAGFPTKLGEYLASGRPTVVTRTGELQEYLVDGQSAYLAPPDDSVAFAARLRHALLCRDEAEEVGRRGQELARDCFDYRENGKRVWAFIRSLAEEAAPKWRGGIGRLSSGPHKAGWE
ncbi:MAG: glycosyltransferase family 4 protein [Armatimonadetes bacterium]|nr:glycosyltransferase family 4 protein [Armatimonadota bacterium]